MKHLGYFMQQADNFFDREKQKPTKADNARRKGDFQRGVPLRMHQYRGQREWRHSQETEDDK